MESHRGKLADRFDRVLPCCTGKPVWPSERLQSFSTENSTGGDHLAGVQHFCRAGDERALSLEICRQFCFFNGGGLFHVHQKVWIISISLLSDQTCLIFAFDGG